MDVGNWVQGSCRLAQNGIIGMRHLDDTPVPGLKV